MIAWPDTESAVHTIPAIAITKNIPVVPDRPNRSSTTDEMMIVSIVMPDTGLRAVVAIAFAATDVKKNENSSVSPSPTRITDGARVSRPRKIADAHRADRDPRQNAHRPECPGRCARPPPRRVRNACSATPNDPATTRSDFSIPKIPAVAIAPTPMNRTYPRKIWTAVIFAIGIVAG